MNDKKKTTKVDYFVTKPGRKKLDEEMMLEMLDEENHNPIEKSSPLFGEGFVKMFLAPYALPTLIRTFRDIKKEYSDLSTKQKIGFFSGVGLGSLTDICQVAGYYNMSVNEGIPEVLLLPLATNVFSGIYELGRWRINKSRKKFAENC